MGYLDDLSALSGLTGLRASASQSTNAHYVTGTAVADSSGGSVLVDMGGTTVSGSGDQWVELPTTCEVRDGDVVQVQLVGADWTAKSMCATGVVGGGDRTKAAIEDAAAAAGDAQEQVLDVSARLDQSASDITATIESKVAAVQDGVDANAASADDLNQRLTSEIHTRQSFMRFSEEDSSPTLTLGSSDSPAQMRLTNSQLQFLYQKAVVAYMSSDTLHISNAQVIQQLLMGGFAAVPRGNGNLAVKWVGEG